MLAEALKGYPNIHKTHTIVYIRPIHSKVFNISLCPSHQLIINLSRDYNDNYITKNKDFTELALESTKETATITNPG